MTKTELSGIDSKLSKAKDLIDKKLYTEAELFLRNMANQYVDDPRIWNALGYLFYTKEKFDKALSAYQRCWGLDPNSAKANYSVGLTLKKLGRLDEAKTFLVRTLELEPKNEGAVRHLDAITLSLSQSSGASSVKSSTDDRFKNNVKLASRVENPKTSLSEQIKQGRVDPGTLLISANRTIGSALSAMLFPITFFAGLGIFISAIATQWITSYIDNDLLTLLLLVSGILFLFTATLRSRTTHYTIFERRIDFELGFIKKTVKSVWLFEVTGISFEQPFNLQLARTGRIMLKSEKSRPVYITGLTNTKDMKELYENMRDLIIEQRRDIKGQWI
jgi:tetratricopeptide (TPR) repeat protein